jgi:4-amino-4-deoxy-L-arabinose transferase-like glycosyltransferase
VRREPVGGFLVAIVLVVAGVLALFWLATAAEAPRPLTDDERDYLSAASNLERHHVFSSAMPTATPPAPDAYREPGYAALLALSWRFQPLAPPEDAADIEGFARHAGRVRGLKRLNVLLLFAAATAAGALVARLADGLAGGLAFLLVAASPALQASARLAAAENLAAPLVVAATLALVIAVDGSLVGAALAGLAFGALPLVRGAGTVAILAAALVLGFVGTDRPRWLARLTLFLALASVPTLAWQLRNFERLGRFVLTDRGGLALAVRAELDREIARHGALAAALAWTPVDAAHRAAERRAPEARFDSPIWTGEGNFFSRVVAPWRDERRQGGDSLALDARLRQEALAQFGAHPLDHLAATAAVSWRALFAEKSPGWTSPFDLRLVIGLLFVATMIGVALPAARGHDPRLIALLVPVAALFLFHAFATEFLPRYALPLLPMAWSVLALVACGGVAPQPDVPRRSKRA